MSDIINVSVITPSLNMLDYLKRCCASVRDQRGSSHEHIVVDGVSTDGTVEWLNQQANIRCRIEPDTGMYDAVNKGFAQSQGQIISYLNCDEQYLPGTLQFVKEFFDQNPAVDILFGDFLVVRPDGSLLCYRKAFPPRWFYFSSAHLYLFTCTMFLRRRIVEAHFQFDSKYRDVADEDFVVRLLRNGYKAKYVNRYLSAFTFTGKNRSQTAAALNERRIMRRSVPTWVKVCKYPLILSRYVEKVIAGAYRESMPLEYAIYPDAVATERQHFRVDSATWKWPR